MELKSKIIIFVCILSYFAVEFTSTAQVQQVFDLNSDDSWEKAPVIKIMDNRLFALTPEGVYSQEMDQQGNLIGNEFLPSEIFKSFEFKVKNFAVKGDTVVVVTTNRLKEQNSVMRSVDGGVTWIDITDWDVSQFDKACPVALREGAISDPNELFIISYSQIFRSSDFGETWDKKGMIIGSYERTHPLDSKISVMYVLSDVAAVYNKYLHFSYDYGQTWNYGKGLYVYNNVAFHYSDPNTIILNGEPIALSRDCAYSWEYVNEWGYENLNKILNKADFDTRGSDRLYGIRNNEILYSDDFGANWTNLCYVGADESDYIVDFVQTNSKIYCISKNYKGYQIDLELLESAVEEITADNCSVSVSVVGNNLQINSQIPVSAIDIFNIGGIKLVSQDCVVGSIDISELAKGTYVARLTTSEGNTISVKFNK